MVIKYSPSKAREKTREIRAIEQQIQEVYESSPIVKRGTSRGKPVSQYYKPTSEQEQKIIVLAEKLPPYTQAKYITKPPTWKETTATGGILEKGYAWKSGTRLHSGPKIYEMPIEQQKVVLARTLPFREVVAGLVSVPEQWGGLLGKPTPPGPISGTMGLVTGRPKAWEEYAETPLLYKLGQAPAMVLESAVIGVGLGWVGGKAWALTKKVTPEVIKHPISQTVRFGRVAKVAHKMKLAVPSYRGSRLDVFLAKHSKWYYKTTRKGMASGMVAIPPITEPISLGKLKASKLAFDLTVAPRTSGIWVGKTVTTITKPTSTFQYLFKPAGVGATWILKKGTGGLLVPDEQIQMVAITKSYGHYAPYIPKMVSTTGKKGFSALVSGVVGTTLLKGVKQPSLLKRKVWQPTLALEREKLRNLLDFTPKTKEKEKLFPILKLTISQAPKLVVKQIPTIKQIPKLIHPRPVPTVPSRPITPKLPPFLRRRGGRGWPKRGRSLTGKWFLREHPIPTAKQMLGGVRITSERKRKRSWKGFNKKVKSIL